MGTETILVVDDNKEIVYSISELLKFEGYQVEKAYDGMEALDALERRVQTRRIGVFGPADRDAQASQAASPLALVVPRAGHHRAGRDALQERRDDLSAQQARGAGHEVARMIGPRHTCLPWFNSGTWSLD